LLALYAAPPAIGFFPASDEMLKMYPPPRRFICGIAS
jgi:hypothetical protein